MSRWQAFLGKLRPEHRIGVFVDLLWRLEIFLVAPIVLELTLVRRVVPADLRSCLVDSTSVIITQVLARRVDQKVPIFPLDKYRCTIVQQVPSHEIEVPARDGLVNRKSEVVATLCGAVLAEVRVGREIAAASHVRTLCCSHGESERGSGKSRK